MQAIVVHTTLCGKKGLCEAVPRIDPSPSQQVTVTLGIFRDAEMQKALDHVHGQ